MGRILVALGLALGLATAAGADTVRSTAPIVAMRIHGINSDEGFFDGFIMVGDSIGGYARYNWGGSFCPGVDLNAEEVEILQRALNNPRIPDPAIHEDRAGRKPLPGGLQSRAPQRYRLVALSREVRRLRASRARSSAPAPSDDIAPGSGTMSMSLG